MRTVDPPYSVTLGNDNRLKFTIGIHSKNQSSDSISRCKSIYADEALQITWSSELDCGITIKIDLYILRTE
jgi:hypothetical protein